MMSEIPMHHLIAFPTNAPSSTELWFACPQRRHELAREEADYLRRVLTESMDRLAAILVEEAGRSVTAKVMKEQLVRPFVYAFGKGIEIVYKLRVGAEEPVQRLLALLYKSDG
jgi:hypothetical protein